MMKSTGAITLMIGILALVACDRTPVAGPPVPQEALDPTGGLAPPLVVPGENTVPAHQPSYEVSIASAAADHNKALERCMRQPDAVRTQCEQEANAAFAEVVATLEPLRGNQE